MDVGSVFMSTSSKHSSDFEIASLHKTLHDLQSYIHLILRIIGGIAGFTSDQMTLELYKELSRKNCGSTVQVLLPPKASTARTVTSVSQPRYVESCDLQSPGRDSGYSTSFPAHSPGSEGGGRYSHFFSNLAKTLEPSDCRESHQLGLVQPPLVRPVPLKPRIDRHRRVHERLKYLLSPNTAIYPCPGMDQPVRTKLQLQSSNSAVDRAKLSVNPAEGNCNQPSCPKSASFIDVKQTTLPRDRLNIVNVAGTDVLSQASPEMDQHETLSTGIHTKEYTNMSLKSSVRQALIDNINKQELMVKSSIKPESKLISGSDKELSRQPNEIDLSQISGIVKAIDKQIKNKAVNNIAQHESSVWHHPLHIVIDEEPILSPDNSEPTNIPVVEQTVNQNINEKRIIYKTGCSLGSVTDQSETKHCPEEPVSSANGVKYIDTAKGLTHSSTSSKHSLLSRIKNVDPVQINFSYLKTKDLSESSICSRMIGTTNQSTKVTNKTGRLRLNLDTFGIESNTAEYLQGPATSSSDEQCLSSTIYGFRASKTPTVCLRSLAEKFIMDVSMKEILQRSSASSSLDSTSIDDKNKLVNPSFPQKIENTVDKNNDSPVTEKPDANETSQMEDNSKLPDMPELISNESGDVLHVLSEPNSVPRTGDTLSVASETNKDIRPHQDPLTLTSNCSFPSKNENEESTPTHDICKTINFNVSKLLDPHTDIANETSMTATTKPSDAMKRSMETSDATELSDDDSEGKLIIDIPELLLNEGPVRNASPTKEGFSHFKKNWRMKLTQDNNKDNCDGNEERESAEQSDKHSTAAKESSDSKSNVSSDSIPDRPPLKGVSVLAEEFVAPVNLSTTEGSQPEIQRVSCLESVKNEDTTKNPTIVLSKSDSTEKITDLLHYGMKHISIEIPNGLNIDEKVDNFYCFPAHPVSKTSAGLFSKMVDPDSRFGENYAKCEKHYISDQRPGPTDEDNKKNTLLKLKNIRCLQAKQELEPSEDAYVTNALGSGEYAGLGAQTPGRTTEDETLSSSNSCLSFLLGGYGAAGEDLPVRDSSGSKLDESYMSDLRSVSECAIPEYLERTILMQDYFPKLKKRKINCTKSVEVNFDIEHRRRRLMNNEASRKHRESKKKLQKDAYASIMRLQEKNVKLKLKAEQLDSAVKRVFEVIAMLSKNS